MFNPFEASEDIVVTDFTDELLLKFRNQVLKKSMIDPVQPIVVSICSNGGSADALAGYLATLESVPNKIITVAIGKAFSCGAILLAAGDYRFIHKDARVMIHEVSGGSWGNVHSQKASAEEMGRLNEHWLGHFAKNCGLKDYKEFRTILKEYDGEEIWFDAKSAKDFGIVDFIGNPQVRPFVIFDIGCINYDRVPATDAMSDPGEVLKSLEESTKKKASKKKASKKKTSKKKASKKINKKKTLKKATSGPIELPDPLRAFSEQFPDFIRVRTGEFHEH